MGRKNRSQARTRVLVVDDHSIVREGICVLLEREPYLEVVGSVDSGEAAMEFLQANGADVVIMDVGLPGISGIEATRRIKGSNPNVHVLALTMYADDQYLLGMLDAGAAGYLLKQSVVSDLIQATRALAAGQYFLDPAVTKMVIESRLRHRQQPSSGPALTEREKGILRLIGQGRTTKEIGTKLSLSPKTVENYRARIMEKLQTRNCYEAVSSAIKQGIIEVAS